MRILSIVCIIASGAAGYAVGLRQGFIDSPEKYQVRVGINAVFAKRKSPGMIIGNASGVGYKVCADFFRITPRPNYWGCSVSQKPLWAD